MARYFRQSFHVEAFETVEPEVGIPEERGNVTIEMTAICDLLLNGCEPALPLSDTDVVAQSVLCEEELPSGLQHAMYLAEQCLNIQNAA